MNFFDNYYETAQKIRSKSARQEFYAAVIEYYYSGGSEPQFKYESAEVGFTSVRISLDKSLQKSKNRRKTKPKENEIEIESKEEGNPNPSGKNIFLSSSLLSSDLENQGDNASFPLLCLDALNHALGVTYPSMPEMCERALLEAEGRYSVDDVRAMVEGKRDLWQDDPKMRHCLTPKTLFSPEKFETYMIVSQKAREKDASYDYDRDEICI